MSAALSLASDQLELMIASESNGWQDTMSFKSRDRASVARRSAESTDGQWRERSTADSSKLNPGKGLE